MAVAGDAGTTAASWRGLAVRLMLCLGALAAVALALHLVALWLAAGTPPPPAPVRNPFGTGIREAAPAASGLSGLILAWQGSFYRSLTAALSAVQSGGGIAALIGLSFAYGIFHAAGPGHGKAVISAYLVADDSAWKRGITLSLAASLVQGAVALAIVGIFAALLGGTAAQMNNASRMIELASFAALALFGLWLLWRQAGRVLAARHRAAALACADDCDHGPSPAEAMKPRPWRETIGIVLAAGARPCTGAIVVLVFALSQGLIWAGAAAVLAMSLGTAMTTSALAILAVFAKRTALRLASGRPGTTLWIGATLELAAAAFVAVLGLALLSGLWTSTGGT